MEEKLQELEKQARQEIEGVADSAELAQVRVKYLGRKGLITEVFRSLPSLPQEERPKVGKLANEVKNRIAALLEEREKVLARYEKLRERLDLTLPGRVPSVGHPHPIVETMNYIVEIFEHMGFEVAEGPEVETEYYNFEALNTPADHPARDEQDSFYVGEGVLLRTQTSAVQIHVMEKRKPPVKVVAPGRCFRRDAIDASHLPVFHQIEGLVVDEGISFADLKGTLEVFARHIAGEGAKVRFRPDFFPFTEPSAEFAISCFICKGKGCRVCSGGWMELGGAGMVDPAVFEVVGYDYEKYTGFAFGMGIERIAMAMFGIDDIRVFFDNDLRFLTQF